MFGKTAVTKKDERTKLAELELERGKTAAELADAKKTVDRIKRELIAAEKNLGIATAASASGGWSERREAKRWAGIVESVKERLEAARERVKETEGKIEPIEDVIMGIQIGRVGPEIQAARKMAVELKALLRQQQEAALETAKRLAALLAAVVAKTPKRLVSMRSEKYLKVEIRDPVISSYHGGEDPEQAKAQGREPKPVFFSVEYFKAVAGERRGKWKIVPGQDMDPGKVEKEYCAGDLPAELEDIKTLDLRRLTTLNGKKPTEMERQTLDFNFIRFSVTKEELAEVTKAIEEAAT
jgi:ribosome-binding protein aMBF1 (putative translation factor)